MTSRPSPIADVFAALATPGPARRVHRCPLCFAEQPAPRTCAGCVSRQAIERLAGSGAACLEQIPDRYRQVAKGHPLMASHPHRMTAYRDAAEALRKGVLVVTLRGVAGAGKTVTMAALAHAMAKSAEEGGIKAARAGGLRWYSAKVLGDAARQSPLGVRPYAIGDAERATVLCLDELGQETDPGAIREVLYERHEHERPTLITTYLADDELARRYDAGGARRLLEAPHAVVVEVRP